MPIWLQAPQGLLLFSRAHGDSPELIPVNLLFHSLIIKKIPQKIRYPERTSLHSMGSWLIPESSQFGSSSSCKRPVANCNQKSFRIVLTLRKKGSGPFQRQREQRAKKSLSLRDASACVRCCVQRHASTRVRVLKRRWCFWQVRAAAVREPPPPAVSFGDVRRVRGSRGGEWRWLLL